MKTTIGFLLVAVFVVGGVAQGQFSCLNEGCSLDPSISGGVVCGEDGVTYWNACLAECQEITVKSLGRCQEEDAPVAKRRFPPDNDSFDSSTRVSLDTMMRFAHKGFRFVGRRNVDRFYDGPVTEPLLEESFAVSRPVTLQAIRITQEGDEYVSPVLGPTRVDGLPRTSAGFVGKEQDSRRLKIIGEDTRSDVADPTVYPMRTIGRFPRGCTGTLISRNSVVTAAHCVYSVNLGIWTRFSRWARFVPAGHVDEDGRRQAPFGSWDASDITIYSHYAELGDIGYDIAVINYRPRKGDCVWMGDLVGYAGFREVTFDDASLQASTTVIAGYGFDKWPDLWTSGPCDGSPPFQTFLFGLHQSWLAEHWCDTESGNSGAAVLDTVGALVQGVHVAALGEGRGNLAVLFSTESPHYDSIVAWTDGDDELQCPSTEKVCPCARLFQVVCILLNRCLPKDLD